MLVLMLLWWMECSGCLLLVVESCPVHRDWCCCCVGCSGDVVAISYISGLEGVEKSLYRRLLSVVVVICYLPFLGLRWGVSHSVHWFLNLLLLLCPLVYARLLS